VLKALRSKPLTTKVGNKAFLGGNSELTKKKDFQEATKPQITGGDRVKVLPKNGLRKETKTNVRKRGRMLKVGYSVSGGTGGKKYCVGGKTN